jgi:hypothetical protein
MARGKALTAEELTKFGAKQLATLLVEACESDPQLRHGANTLSGNSLMSNVRLPMHSGLGSLSRESANFDPLRPSPTRYE